VAHEVRGDDSVERIEGAFVASLDKSPDQVLVGFEWRRGRRAAGGKEW
jgi:hypothetical protein